MPKFRKKPVEVIAVRMHHVDVIPTLEGHMTVGPGDWVITGVKGEEYPCKDEIFRLTYDPVDGSAQQMMDAPMPQED